MDLKRRLARATAVLAIALAAGHLVQNSRRATIDADGKPLPTAVTLVAAGPDAIGQPARNALPPADPVPDTPALDAAALAPADTGPAVEAALIAAPDAEAPLPAAPLPAASADAPLDTPAPVAETCPVVLDLTAEPGARMGVVVTAPCNPNERMVLNHAGLAITLRTTDTGVVYTSIPALEPDAEVSIKFGNGRRVSSRTQIPEAATIRRFGIQWQGTDGFGIHAFENGASYGQPGDVSAANPHLPLTGTPARGGYLMLLGDSTVDLPLLAEVYTFPADASTRVEIVTDGMVTRSTCGADLLGETLNMFGGRVQVTDLTVAMPACDAAGDYLVLKNLALDPTLAAAN